MSKVVRIFLASSIREFKKERIYIGEYIQRRNSNKEKGGEYVRLFLCEDESRNYQPIYDRHVINSDVCITFIGNRLGEYTKDELYLAKKNELNRIKKRIIVLISSNLSLIPDDLFPFFEVYELDSFSFDKICEIFEVAIESVSAELTDYSVDLRPFTFHVCGTNYSASLDHAVFYNEIRAFNDQLIEMLGDSTFYQLINIEENAIVKRSDAYLSLISEKQDEELLRLYDILEIIEEKELLWLFVKNGFEEKLEVFLQKYGRGHYAEYYESYVDLSRLFKIQLNSVLFFICKIDDKYQYIIEDHILKKQSLISHEKSAVTSLNIPGTNSPDAIFRKERIIINLLELYRMTGNISKHKETIEQILNSEYDFLTYDPKMIKSYPWDQYEATIDYVMDSLELLFRSELTSREMINRIQEIVLFPKNQRYILKPEDEFIIKFFCVNLLSIYGRELQEEREEYLCDVITIYDKIEHPDYTAIEHFKYCLIQLCEANYRRNNDYELLLLADRGLAHTNELIQNDIVFRFLFLVYKARSLRQQSPNEAKRLYNEAERLLRVDYNKDNESLYLYIQVRYEVLMDPNNYCDINVQELKDLEYKYNQFLSHNSDYELAFVYLNILNAKCLLNNGFVNEAIEKCRLAIEITENNSLLENTDPCYLYLYYTLSDFLQRKGEEGQQEAILILERIYSLYSGFRDKALCQQNIALCYMSQYNIDDALLNAETAYRNALKLYEKMDSDQEVRECMGNVLDGLAYCNILQSKFDESLSCSKRACDIEEYKTPKKFCNLISSFIYKKRYLDAFRLFYKLSIDERSIIIKQLKDDIMEIKEVGINIIYLRLFSIIFRLCHYVI